MCNIVERNQDQILSYFNKQEEILANELYEYFSRKARRGFAELTFDQTFGLYHLETKKFSFPLKKSLSDMLFTALNKHVETIRKSSKTLNIVAEICENKIGNCIILVDEYIKSYDEKDLQVGEAGHFMAWLEVNKKVDVDLIGKLKSKYGVSITNLQNSNITDIQSTTNVSKISTPTPTQQAQPVDSVPQTLTGNTTPPQKTSTSNRNNNNLGKEQSSQQLPVVDNKIHNFLQKQPSGVSPRGWTIGLALLFGAVGATLAAIGIIPEIATIGVVATAVLLGIVGTALGGAVGYLTDITVNNFYSEAAVQAA